MKYGTFFALFFAIFLFALPVQAEGAFEEFIFKDGTQTNSTTTRYAFVTLSPNRETTTFIEMELGTEIDPHGVTFRIYETKSDLQKYYPNISPEGDSMDPQKNNVEFESYMRSTGDEHARFSSMTRIGYYIVGGLLKIAYLEQYTPKATSPDASISFEDRESEKVKHFRWFRSTDSFFARNGFTNIPLNKKDIDALRYQIKMLNMHILKTLDLHMRGYPHI